MRGVDTPRPHRAGTRPSALGGGPGSRRPGPGVSRRASPCHSGAEGRDPVIPAAFVVQFRSGTILSLDDQALFEHPLNRAVKRPGAQLQFAVRARGHVLDDGVAMPVVDGHGERNVESCRRER